MVEAVKKCCATCRHFGGGPDTVLPCLAPLAAWVFKGRIVNKEVIHSASLMIGREGEDCPAYDAQEKVAVAIGKDGGE